MAVGLKENTPIVNRVIPDPSLGLTTLPYYIGTFNKFKQQEIATELGVPIGDLPIAPNSFPEIQDEDPLKVLRAKAIAAYINNGGVPVLVEDVSLDIASQRDLLPSTYVKSWAKTPEARSKICRIIHETKSDDRATVQVAYAVWDGRNLHTRTATTHGRIAEKPRGPHDFGFDDIFIPDNQEEEYVNGKPRTLAEMKQEEKAQIFARQEALKKIKNDPFPIGIWVHALTPALQMELDAIKKEFFKGENMGKALRHAYNIRTLGNMEPNDDLTIDTDKLLPYHEIKLHPNITWYTVNPNGASLGTVITDYEKRTKPNGDPTRLQVNLDW